MRKIGYSVGLEKTFERIQDLCDIYIENGQLTISGWSWLVHEKWKLKNDHIGDFFNSLSLLKRSKSKIDVLSGLDLCALSRLIDKKNDDEDQSALRGAVLLLLIENDGEILLNCLSAGFQSTATVDLLTELIKFKRSILFDIFRAPEVQFQIARVVGIDRQATNIGGAGKGGRGLRDLRRTEPLSKRTESLRGPQIPEVDISDDYLDKVIPRRRDWAHSLGLVDANASLTENGSAMMRLIANSGLNLENGAVVLWPFEHEVSRLRMSPIVFEGRTISYWRLVQIALTGIGAPLKTDYDESDVKFVLEGAEMQIAEFREMNRPKAMLRRELPLTIAYYTLAVNFSASGRCVPPLDQVIDHIRVSEQSNLEIRSSRNSIGTLGARGR